MSVQSSPAPPSREVLEEFFTPQRLWRMRAAAGLTQQQAAEEVGLLSYMAYWNWEADNRRPSARSLVDIWQWYCRLVAAGTYPNEFGGQ